MRSATALWLRIGAYRRRCVRPARTSFMEAVCSDGFHLLIHRHVLCAETHSLIAEGEGLESAIPRKDQSAGGPLEVTITTLWTHLVLTSALSHDLRSYGSGDCKEGTLGRSLGHHEMDIQSYSVHSLLGNRVGPEKSMCDGHSIFSFCSPAFFWSRSSAVFRRPSRFFSHFSERYLDVFPRPAVTPLLML